MSLCVQSLMTISALVLWRRPFIRWSVATRGMCEQHVMLSFVNLSLPRVYCSDGCHRQIMETSTVAGDNMLSVGKCFHFLPCTVGSRHNNIPQCTRLATDSQ